MSQYPAGFVGFGNSSVAFPAPTSVFPLKYPSFTVNHYDKKCVSNPYTARSSTTSTTPITGFPRIGKRKSNSTESTFHPLTKQQITEARIAASMKSLSLENPPIPSSSGNSGSHMGRKMTDDEGFYDLDCDTDCDRNERAGVGRDGAGDDFPHFCLADTVKDDINNMMNDILPEQILKTINQNSMALIPYVPPEIVLAVPTEDTASATMSSTQSKAVDASEEEAMTY